MVGRFRKIYLDSDSDRLILLIAFFVCVAQSAGGKQTNFEGGVRVPAFVGGGFLPPAVRGTTLSGYIHAADW